MIRWISILAALSFILPIQGHALSEKDFQSNYTSTIIPFLTKHGIRETFPSHDGKHHLSAIHFKHPREKAALIVVNGLTETWIKYGEVFYDFYQKGYSIYSFDHLGQGLSPHLVNNNPQIVHADDFDDYVANLDQFMKNVVQTRIKKGSKLFAIAHSMGGAILTRYLQTHSNGINAVVLSAPMMKLNTAPYSTKIAKIFVDSLILIGKGQSYAPGKKDHACGVSITDSTVTSSSARLWMNEEICQTHPQSVTGGPSNSWVSSALKGSEKVRSHAKNTKPALLIFKAGSDVFVINEAIDSFCSKATDCRTHLFPGAKHEILMERDSIRDQAILKTDQFFQE